VYDDGNPGGATAIWVMNRDGTVKRRLTHGATRDINPAWSPDGRNIAFIRVSGTAQNAPQSIYVMDGTGKHVHPLHPGGKQLVPAWQPVPAGS
jgi:Tol biopolymer transport system component